MTKLSTLLSVGEVAELFDVHPQTVYRWCEQGAIPYIQVTPRSPRRFRREDILALLEPKLGASSSAAS